MVRLAKSKERGFHSEDRKQKQHIMEMRVEKEKNVYLESEVRKQQHGLRKQQLSTTDLINRTRTAESQSKKVNAVIVRGCQLLYSLVEENKVRNILLSIVFSSLY